MAEAAKKPDSQLSRFSPRFDAPPPLRNPTIADERVGTMFKNRIRARGEEKGGLVGANKRGVVQLIVYKHRANFIHGPNKDGGEEGGRGRKK